MDSGDSADASAQSHALENGLPTSAPTEQSAVRRCTSWLLVMATTDAKASLSLCLLIARTRSAAAARRLLPRARRCAHRLTRRTWNMERRPDSGSATRSRVALVSLSLSCSYRCMRLLHSLSRSRLPTLLSVVQSTRRYSRMTHLELDWCVRVAAVAHRYRRRTCCRRVVRPCCFTHARRAIESVRRAAAHTQALGLSVLCHHLIPSHLFYRDSSYLDMARLIAS